PYSQAVTNGNLLFVSGQLPIEPGQGVIVSGDIAEQARQSLENVKAILEKAGYEMRDVVKTTCYLTEMENFAVVNEIYAEYFVGNYPARSCVSVKELPKQALFELEVIACK
ncbi:Rid family detoxifying hydrolase, partial [[Clostridium] innocuum]|nr:Rid family detoxifying hydrolase [[Clostridium] innocuum]